MVKRIERQQTYQLLMGLRPEFESLHTQILNTTPVPSLFEAFAMIDGDERRRRLASSSAPSIPSTTVSDQMDLAASSRYSDIHNDTRNYGSGSHGHGRGHGNRLVCGHGGRTGHERARCFKLYPHLMRSDFSAPSSSGSTSSTAAVAASPVPTEAVTSSSGLIVARITGSN
ncbi:hypothetical protein GIB67_020833 [Kingdonia uniflora]|uniref:Uncharacterized protein n=1 Tax=Kingdonia uniflora TaxID=39325 RepID=A0A7J7M7G4_9MAGN|nr:hypothetical protein GIB67_020833 [Kingdonia uniflora]